MVAIHNLFTKSPNEVNCLQVNRCGVRHMAGSLAHLEKCREISLNIVSRRSPAVGENCRYFT